MLTYLHPALMTSFLRTFIIKDNANNGRNLSSSSFPALMTSFPVLTSINEGAQVVLTKKS